jgi:hypothetical protein
MDNFKHLNDIIKFGNTKYSSINLNKNILEISVNQIKKGFLKQLNSLNSIELYEIYKTEDIYIRPYFDIDVKIKNDSLIKENDVLELVIFKIKEFFDCSNSDIAILSDHRIDKISFHINIINQYTTMNEIRQWNNDFANELEMDYFDPNIYHSGETKWRTIYSSKVVDNKPLTNGLIKVSDHEDIDFIISYTNSNMKRWNYNSLKQENKINNNQTYKLCKNKINKFQDYLKCIDKNRFDNYNNWFKLACIFKNIGIDYQIFNDYCININGYDGNKNEEIYNNIDINNNKKAKWKALYLMAEEDNIKLKNELDLKYNCSQNFDFEIFNNINFKIIKCYNNDIEKIDLLIKLADNNKDRKKYIKDKEELNYKLENEIYKKQKEYFEKYHFILDEPTLIVKKNNDGLYYYSYHTINNTYERLNNNFIKKWKKDSFAKHYTKIDFLPPPKLSNKTTYNLYNDIPILSHDITNNDIDIFLNHCYYLSGKNDKAKDYLLDYLSHLIQKPGILPNVALIFKSIQGTGKSLFFHKLLTNIFGKEKVLSTGKCSDLYDRFNSLGGKIACILDETCGKDSFSNNEIIKNIITSDQLKVEFKGKDSYYVNNFCRFIFLTNNDTPMKIELSDRRFMVFECSSEVKNIPNYFEDLFNSLDNMDKIKGFYNFLLNRDISKLHLEKDRVLTDTYLDIQSVNIPIIIRFVKYYTLQYIIPDSLIEINIDEFEFSNPIKDILKNKECITSTNLYNLFIKWNKDFNYNISYNITQFGRELNKYIDKKIGIMKDKKGIIFYNFDFKLLLQYFKENPLI